MTSIGTALVAVAFAVTALAAAPTSRADCDNEAVGGDSCAAQCPADQVRDEGSGQCAAKADQNAEAPLQAAWQAAFGTLPVPPAGVDLSSIAPSVSAAASALPALAMLAPPQLPAPPPLPCFGFATPIPFVGFSTC